MDMISKKLLSHMESLREKEAHYIQTGIGGFFGDILPRGIFPHGMPYDMEEVIEYIGDDLFDPLYPVALEFFFSNEYPNPESEKLWNFIDSFLRKKGKLLSPKDKTYCKSLRDSYMGVYEVIDIDLGKSLTLRDMIDENKKPFKVKEKQATYNCYKWDVLGARIVQSGSSFGLAGGVLRLDKDIYEEIIDRIRTIHGMMLEELKKNKYPEYDFPELSMKKMWVKEIAEGWLHFHMFQNMEAREFVNIDGEKIKLCTLEFPIKINTPRMSEILSSFKELAPDKERNTWIWVTKEEGPRKKINKKNLDLDADQTLDTKVQSKLDNKLYSIYATVSLKRRKLLIEVNSEQRANIVEDFFKTRLKNLVGECRVFTADLQKNPAHHGSDLIEDNPAFSGEEMAEFMKAFFDEHYETWFESPIDFLDGQTPLQAAKTKEGRKKVISLIKGQENAHLRLEKDIPTHLKYDFSWVYKKLGIKTSELKGL